jgi:hypothetical protein
MMTLPVRSCRTVLTRLPVTAPAKACRSLASSRPPQPVGNNQVEAEEFKHPQEFVKIQFEPGEWDPDKTDPLFKPPFKSRAKILSADDFAQRPRVGFEEEFDSLRDGMVTLTHLDGNDCDKIYGAYLDLMTKQGSGKTSHEYVLRVLAQRFNLTLQRVAAIVQLGHNEDQYRKQGRKIWYEAQEVVDRKFKDHIRKAYSEYSENEPMEFVEDPMGVTGILDREATTSAHIAIDDLVDVDQLTQDQIIREQNDARLKIDGHIYKGDIDESTVNVKLSQDSRTLLETQKALQQNEHAQRPGDLKPMPGGDQSRRPRWKYVAHTVNTRESKKKTLSQKERQTRILDDVLVEQDGEIRAATLKEIKSTSWKPMREFEDFTITGVKTAWMDRTLKGVSGGWGRQKAPEPPPKDAAKDEESDKVGSDQNDSDEEQATSDENDEDSTNTNEESSSTNDTADLPDLQEDEKKD